MFQKNPAFTPAPRPAAKLPPLEHYLKVQDDLLTQLATLLDRERVALRCFLDDLHQTSALASSLKRMPSCMFCTGT